ncbi:M48 family metalloprotease [Pseudomonas sp. L-22-4S-12]|uniref:M48 family metalloprotease n=1 Tax=Pseudomonas sp. L-22-4S-12 TaxID=2610893 RepID=UPI001329C620|nr:M48 family metalloprotease [Pseudomonas sp. L-22-4S-12]MWV15302.1 M48 family metalloprotease [Pseudomonas sp. L-22-4S-12]
MIVRCALLLVVLWQLVGCAVNPATGRTDFVMMSERQEIELGQRYSQEILKQYPRYPDEKLQTYVQQVGERVARYGHRSQLQYRFTVIDSPDINAFALPGGHIYIHRGLMAYLGSEAELAAVLGHEVGHVTARHSVRQQSQSTAWNILGQAVAVGTGVGVAGDLTNVLGGAFVSGYGRDMELEADGLGAQYLARSGYDPQAMIEVVKVLKAQEDFARDQAQAKGQEVPPSGYHGLFDTHPDNDTRLRQVVAAASPLASGQGEVGRDVYLRQIEGMPFGDSAAAGVRRGQRFYHGGLDFTLAFPPGWELINRADAVIVHAPDQQAFVVMSLEPLAQQATAQEYLARRAGRQQLVQQDSFRQAGLEVATGVVPGSAAKRVAVIMREKQAFLFVAAVKGHGSLESQDAQFLEVIRSFRPLQAQERELTEPRRLRLVQLKPGQGLEALSGQMSVEGDPLTRLRLLNGLYPGGQPRPKAWLKMVR